MSLSWMPSKPHHPDEPPQGLEAPGSRENEHYHVSPVNDPTAPGNWLLVHQKPDEVIALGHFNDATSAQLAAQEHHDRHRELEP